MPDFDALYGRWSERREAIGRFDRLFVVGCAKSGTTWLENLLHGHPEIHLRGEGRYFWSLGQQMQQVFRGFNASLPGADAADPARWPDDEFACLMRCVIEAQLARAVASGPAKARLRIVGDKTPMHTLAVGALHQLYPRAKFVHIIRDPRDATISQWLFWAKENDPRPFEEFVEYSITKVWPLNVESARRAGRGLGALYAEVRYEDLLEGCEGEVRRLLRFLGVSEADNDVAACLANGRFGKHAGGRRRGADGGEGHLYRKGVAGDWRNHIPAPLAERCCEQVAPLMRSCGYEPAAAVC